MVSKVFIFCLLLFAAPCFAATHYLDINVVGGNDDGTSWEDAWDAWSEAYAGASAGDTVYIKDGAYGAITISDSPSPASTSWDDKITFEAESGHSPVFTAITISGQHSRYLEFNGLHLRNVTAGTSAIGVTSSDYLKFVDLDLEGVWDEGTYGTGLYGDSNLYDSLSSGFYFSNDAAVDQNDLIIDNCEISKVITGMSWANSMGTGCEVTDCKIHYTARSCMTTPITNDGNNGNFLIDGNEFYDQYQVYTGTDMSHGSGIAVRTSNLTIRNNIIHATGSTAGMMTYGGSGLAGGVGYNQLIIENNLIYDTVNMYALRLGDMGTGSVLIKNNTIIGHHDQAAAAKGVNFYRTSLLIQVVTDGNAVGLTLYSNIVVGVAYFDTDAAEYTEDYNYFYSAADAQFGGWTTSLKGAHTTIFTDNYNVPAASAEGEFDNDWFVDSDYTYTTRDRGDGSDIIIPNRKNLNTGYKLVVGAAAIDFSHTDYATSSDLSGAARDASPDAGAYEYGGTTYFLGGG